LALFLCHVAAEDYGSDHGVKYIISPRLPILDTRVPEVIRSITSEVEMADQFSGAFVKAYGIKSLRDIRSESLSPDERVLAVFPSIQLLRVTRELSAGRIMKTNLILAGSVSYLDPWTRACVTSTTRMIEVRNMISADLSEEQKQEILCGSFSKAFDNWISEMIVSSKERVSPFVLEVRTLKSPGMGILQKRLKGCLLNAGYLQGLQKGMILSKGTRKIRIQDVQKHMSWAVDALNCEEEVRENLIFKVIVNHKQDMPGSTSGLKVRLKHRQLECFAEQNVVDRDSELIILKSYLSKAEHLDILPLILTSNAYRDAIDGFYGYLNRNAQNVDMGVAVSQLISAVLAGENRDLDIELFPSDKFFCRFGGNGEVSELFFRVGFASLITRPMGCSAEQGNLFFDVVEEKNEQVIKEMAGVREVDRDGIRLSVTRNGLILMARSLVKATSNIACGSGPVQYSGTVLNDLSVQWNPGFSAPGAMKPLLWRRPWRGITDPVTGEYLGVFLKIMPTKTGLPLTMGTLNQEALHEGDILSFTRLSGSENRNYVLLKSGDCRAPDVLKLYPDLQLALIAAELKRQIPGIHVVLGDFNDPAVPVLRQIFNVEKFQQSKERIFLQIAWRFRLGNDPGNPVWKIGRRFRDELLFPHSEIGGLDVQRHTARALKSHLKELVEFSRTKNLESALKP